MVVWKGKRLARRQENKWESWEVYVVRNQWLLSFVFCCCMATVRSQLELVIEHLVKRCGWPRAHGQFVCIYAPHVIRRSRPRMEPPWAHIRASHRTGSISSIWVVCREGALYGRRVPSPVGWNQLFSVYGLSVSALPVIVKSLGEVVWLLCEQYEGNVLLSANHMHIVMCVGCV